MRATFMGLVSGERRYLELAGLSTEDKPTSNVMTGSLFLEVDTGDVYAFDETDDGEWYKICALGGGGSESNDISGTKSARTAAPEKDEPEEPEEGEEK